MAPPAGALASPGSMRMLMAISGAVNAGLDDAVSALGPALISQPKAALGRNQRRASSIVPATAAPAASHSHSHHGCVGSVGGGVACSSGTAAATGTEISGGGSDTAASGGGEGSLTAGIVD
jgi:hypothetical protein